MNTSKHGQPIWVTDDNRETFTPRAVDLIALLSGVNFASVKKIFAAIKAVQDSGVHVEDIVAVDAMPAIHARFEDSDECSSRVQYATLAARYIARSQQNALVEDILNLHERMPA